ncbi:MAG: hypothetical protein IJE25_04390 [Clostridia bacterium]|nr:hypothetical protein [Clostridia bacterium]
MKKIFMKLVILCVIIATAIPFTVGCSETENAAYYLCYDSASEWIKDDFLNEHKVKGAYYNGEEAADEALKSKYSFIIKDQSRYNSIFKKDAPKVDFDEKMVLLHIESTAYAPEAFKSVPSRFELKSDGRFLVDIQLYEMKKAEIGDLQPVFHIIIADKVEAAKALDVAVFGVYREPWWPQ